MSSLSSISEELCVLGEDTRTAAPEEESPSETPSKPIRLQTYCRASLDAIPLEVSDEIFIHLPFRTLGYLRLTNKRIKELVEALPVYRILTEGYPHSLRALNLTQHSAEEVYRAFKGPGRCVSCNSFGPFIYLLSLQRWCGRCTLSGAWDMTPVLLPPRRKPTDGCYGIRSQPRYCDRVLSTRGLSWYKPITSDSMRGGIRIPKWSHRLEYTRRASSWNGWAQSPQK
jgi:hypothetical protein